MTPAPLSFHWNGIIIIVLKGISYVRIYRTYIILMPIGALPSPLEMVGCGRVFSW